MTLLFNHRYNLQVRTNMADIRQIWPELRDHRLSSQKTELNGKTHPSNVENLTSLHSLCRNFCSHHLSLNLNLPLPLPLPPGRVSRRRLSTSSNCLLCAWWNITYFSWLLRWHDQPCPNQGHHPIAGRVNESARAEQKASDMIIISSAAQTPSETYQYQSLPWTSKERYLNEDK